MKKVTLRNLDTFRLKNQDESPIVQLDGVKVPTTVFCTKRTQSLFPYIMGTMAVGVLEA